MSTVLETRPPVQTAPAPAPVVTPPTPTPRRRIVGIVALVLAVLAGVALVVAYLVGQTTTTTSNTEYYGAFGPGTTVYRDQVPTVVEPYTTAYTETFGKGSPMYRDQITYPATPLANIPQASPSSEWPPATVTLPPTVSPRQVAPFE